MNIAFFRSKGFKRSLLGVLGAGVLLGGLAACGHHRHHGPMTEAEAVQWQEKMVDRIGSKLDLDATQKQHLTTLGDTLRRQRQTLVAEAGTDPKAELTRLIAGERLDVAGANALVMRKTEALRTASPEVIAAAATFFDSLKPEQQQKVREFVSQPRRGAWGH